ncbi:FtsK/SpoIIIE domain-containing protein [Geodermatophilus sp. CPCC 205761]|uniref:FtsK/SpoIIIE domain-containing protein n=1 Tax=Geodermatophilus sp. CPCC 205761 TaxID=2936597 RepID=UPI003EF04216
MPAPATPSLAARCWTVLTPGGPVDVEVLAPDDGRLDTVLPALADALGTEPAGIWSGSARLPGHLPMADPALAHGAVLGLGRPAPRERAGEGLSALQLHVVGGPGAGTTMRLARGGHLLGRGRGADIPLEDPDVSRRHARIEVGAGDLTVADEGSTNGSRLDGRPVGASPVPWPVGAVLRVGASALTVVGPGGAPAVVRPASAGRVQLRPHPRTVARHPDVEVLFPDPPTSPPRRRLAWVAVALPAVGGVVLASVLGSPHFLFFALLSPVVAVGTWLSDRWSGRQSTRRAMAAHAVELAAADDRLADALRADSLAAHVAHPDLAALATAVRRRSAPLWERRRGDVDAVAVRVGTGPGRTRVTRARRSGFGEREVAPDRPVVVELRSTGGLGVAGPRARAVGVLAGVVAQLAVLHAPGEVDLALLTTPERLTDWAWLRWLPHLAPGAVHVCVAGTDGRATAWLRDVVDRRRARATQTAPGGRPGPADPPGALGWLAVVVDLPADPRLAALLRQARQVGVLVLAPGRSRQEVPAATDAVLELSGETGDGGVLVLPATPDRAEVTVDRLPSEVADTLARDLAVLLPAGADEGVPTRVRLLELSGQGVRIGADGATSGHWPRTRSALVATLGRTAGGVLSVDLCRDGPHALVAGTTGSGKSELLQTLIASLALAHPPDRCSFLLIDYKGGAAFAEAAALPHAVGLLTDLDAAATERALRSLAAELTRRETLLAQHGVADLAALPDTVELARLVIVVDEFAGLVEELPSFVTGLVGIAQRGRSLGVHLVLATQRPSGVVSPEIRANCTLRICLRTTDEAESRDVLGTGSAALLPVELAGRALLRAGAGAPALFQVARVAGSPPGPPDPHPVVRRWQWPRSPAAPPRGDALSGPTDLARICAALAGLAQETGRPRPHRPWCPALPDVVRSGDLPPVSGEDPPDRSAAARARLVVGLVDRPAAQAQEPFVVDLSRGGGWLAVGGAGSGRTTFLRTVLVEAATRLSPAELHVHVLDHGGGALASVAAAWPHAGTTVGGEDPLRTVRLLDRLGQEVARRRAGSSGDRPPHLLLLVDGLESLTGQLDESDPGRGSAALLRLLRDGAAAGLTCLLTADRAIPGSRLAGAAHGRLLLPLPDRADYAVAGVPARLVPAHRPPGRALLGEDAAECQLALPRRADPSLWDGVSAVPAPLRIPELPAVPRLPSPDRSAAPSARDGLHLPLGPGGDEGALLTVDIARTGGLLVVGTPGSGRRTAVQSFGRYLADAGVPVLAVVRGAAHPPAADARTWVSGADLEGWRGWVARLDARPGVVVVDDFGAVADSAVVTAAGAPDTADGLVFVVGGTAGELSSAYRSPVTTLRRSRSGLLLCPAPGDADLLGIRLPRTPLPVRPGSGWLIASGAAQRVQVARRQEAA